MRSGPHRRVVVIAAAAVLGVAVWGGSALAAPPLAASGGGYSACMAGRSDGTFGVTQLDHPSGGPVVVTAVTGITSGVDRALDAVVVRYPGAAVNPVRYGTAGWPIASRWGSPGQAVGASVPAEQAADLVVHLHRAAGHDVTVGPFRIEYTQGAARYAQTADVHLSLRDRC